MGLDNGSVGLTQAGCAGERGAELRELLDQNPVVAIPVIMFRLQQKDREWCAPCSPCSGCSMALA